MLYMCQNYIIYVRTVANLCPYRCKFAMIQTQMLNQNIVFYSAFSLLSLLVLVFSLFSHIRPSSSLNRERTKWHIPHLQIISSKARWPLSPEAQVAWARPLRFDLVDPSLFFGGWLFWLLVVGWFWLMVGGWLGCGCEIWDGYEIWDGLRSGCGLWEWDCVVGVRFVAVECGGVSLALPLILVVVVDVVVFFFGVGVDIGCSVCLSFFFWWQWLILVVGGWFVGVAGDCWLWQLIFGVGCCYCCWW